MKKLFAYFLIFLSVIWIVMCIFKFYLAATGHVDFMGRSPINHFVSGSFQALLAYGAYKLSSFLRNPKEKVE
jgi:hypothetical protein